MGKKAEENQISPIFDGFPSRSDSEGSTPLWNYSSQNSEGIGILSQLISLRMQRNWKIWDCKFLCTSHFSSNVLGMGQHCSWNSGIKVYGYQAGKKQPEPLHHRTQGRRFQGIPEETGLWQEQLEWILFLLLPLPGLVLSPFPWTFSFSFPFCDLLKKEQ